VAVVTATAALESGRARQVLEALRRAG